jgi:hypothetical protein
LLVALAACGSSSKSGAGPGDGGGLDDGSSGDAGVDLLGDGGLGGGDGSSVGCTGLQCQIHACTGVSTGTTITGHVYDPAGNNPLYNVVVYIPNSTVQPLPQAPTDQCGACNSLYTGDPVAAAITDPVGKFTMNDVPTGTNIPLVVQIGKWRSQLVIPTITACAANDLDTLLPSKITLPGAAGISASGPTKGLQQDIPNIAVSTGGADTLECLLRRIGVSASEYTRGSGGTGHIHIFQGSTVPGQLPNAAVMNTSGGPTPLALASLFDTGADLSPYDILILSCEGQETTGTAGGAAGSLTPTELAGLQSYTNAGGRAFLSHFHYRWLDTGPFSTANPPLATWTAGANPIEDKSGGDTQSILGNIVTTLSDGGTFVKGNAFFEWLAATSALTGTQLPIFQSKENAAVSAANTSSQTWITADQNAVTENSNGDPTSTSAAGAAEYFTFDTPLGGAGTDDAGDTTYCGRVVYSDLHVGGASGDYPNQLTPGGNPIVPEGCADNPLTPQEKALEFMLFDLSSCVTPDTGSGQAPPPIIK